MQKHGSCRMKRIIMTSEGNNRNRPLNNEVEIDINLKVDQLDNRSTVQCITSINPESLSYELQRKLLNH